MSARPTGTTPTQCTRAGYIETQSGGGEVVYTFDLAGATTDGVGRAAVLYTAPLSDTLVQINGVLTSAPVITDSGYLYVSAAALPVGGTIAASASGVYTVGNLADNLIEIVKIGGGAPVMGWSVFTGNPCPASTLNGAPVTPYVDVMVYSYEDLAARPGEKTLSYWLEELRSDGALVRHGLRIIAGADFPPGEEPPGAAAGLTPGIYLPLIAQQ